MSSEVSERARELLAAEYEHPANREYIISAPWDSLSDRDQKALRAIEAALSAPPIDDEVTQADRCAASGVYPRMFEERGNYLFSDHIARGEADDHPLVQAFRRHRIAAVGEVRRRTIEECARVAEEYDVPDSLGEYYRGRDIAKALRSLSAKEESR